MVLFVPPGDPNDPTRSPKFYDNTFHYLTELGVPTLSPHFIGSNTWPFLLLLLLLLLLLRHLLAGNVGYYHLLAQFWSADQFRLGQQNLAVRFLRHLKARQRDIVQFKANLAQRLDRCPISCFRFGMQIAEEIIVGNTNAELEVAFSPFRGLTSALNTDRSHHTR